MRVRIPADVDMADRIFFGLTARQLAILGGGLFVLWGVWLSAGERLGPYGFAALSMPVAGAAAAWALARIDGGTLERLVINGLRYFRTPRRRVLAPEGLVPLPALVRGRRKGVAPLEFPVERVTEEGSLVLRGGGVGAICRASSINFALRSEVEQRALLDAFGRVLNALDAPVQFLLRTERADPGALVDEIERRARALPHPALEAAALEHAQFLRGLSARRDVLARQVLVCLREPGTNEAESTLRLRHRVEELQALCRGIGLRLTQLDGAAARRVLARCADPEGLPVDFGGTAVEIVRGAA